MNIYILYCLNFLFGVTTSMGMTLIPLIAIDSLGLSYLAISAIEAISEISSNIMKFLFGKRFDTNKKYIFLYPAVFSFLAKISLFVPHALALLSSKYLERISNGSFSPARDASVPFFTKKTGLCDALMQMSKAAGCIIAPIALAGFAFFGSSLKLHMNLLITVASVLSFVCIILALCINTKKYIYKKEAVSEKKITAKNIIILSSIFFLCRFNDGMLMLFLKKQGYEEWFYVSTIGIFNIFVFLASPVFGLLNDKNLHKESLLITFASMAIFSYSFSSLNYYFSYVLATLGLVMWGIQRAGANLVFINILQKYYPLQRLGYSIGFMHFCSGVSIFLASLYAGFFANINFMYIYGAVSVISTISAIFIYLKFDFIMPQKKQASN